MKVSGTTGRASAAAEFNHLRSSLCPGVGQPETGGLPHGPAGMIRP